MNQSRIGKLDWTVWCDKKENWPKVRDRSIKYASCTRLYLPPRRNYPLSLIDGRFNNLGWGGVCKGQFIYYKWGLWNIYGAVHAKGDIFVKNEYSLQDGT